MERLFVSQSGVVPFRCGSTGLEVLLVTSRTRGRWILPKGNREEGLGLLESALKEAHEEAGVSGTPVAGLAIPYFYVKARRIHRVVIYPLLVDQVFDEWPERPERSREWLPPGEAIRRIEYVPLRRTLKRTLRFLEKSCL